MIERVTSIYFGEQADGIILDGAYDLYTRNRYTEYIKENAVNYLYCKDSDMNLLQFFPETEFITTREEIENIDGLYCLKRLKGLEIAAKNLKKLDLSRFPRLEYLAVIDYSKKDNALRQRRAIKHLFLIHSDIADLNGIAEIGGAESLWLEYCYNLKSLDGICAFTKLNKLTIDYCLKLEDISDLEKSASRLKYLRIADCNKIDNLSGVFSALTEIETLYFSTSQTHKVNKIPSVKFVENLGKLTDFMTDYKIEDGDLTLLGKIKNVEILRSYKHYKR